jgi:hypothetical protein
VSRNGSLLLNITQRGRGDIEPEARRICEDIGLWLKVNGDAVYGSRPFDTWGDEHYIFTRNNGYIYVTMIDWTGGPINIEQLSTNAPSVGKITQVTLIEEGTSVKFKQTGNGLSIAFSQKLTPSIQGVNDTTLAKGFKVIRIKYKKNWFNDDDPGVSTIGWDRQCNRNQGDFNNDLYITDHPGDVWQTSYTGKKVTLVAPTGKDWGKMKIVIDDKDCGTVNLASQEESKPQQQVFTHRSKKGNHTIQVISLSGTAAVDALIIKP